ncbi:monooxygenase [Solwaraspora sp. WMMD1047]|uniref:monooxygenase n=1 Tax=Solwaraspora sp. WMMD1047 TaxID=3016102 RepID=UPI002416F0CE|nr:monooxygenase [Solwaraspora sp. WMMD1047]MDG4832186.1 monooxygenase [Solwaraspora sp. WMMD1047]
MTVPELVTLHVWRIPPPVLPRALHRMAVDRRRLRATPGVSFGKLLGTGTGTGFGPTDADPTRWAALVVWSDPAQAAGFDDSPVGRAWRRIADSAVRLDLHPVASRGRWAGVEPFGDPGPARAVNPPPTGPQPAGPRADETPPAGPQVSDPDPIDARPVLALTRARLRPARAVNFWRAVPPVAAALRDAPGLLCRFGIGEAPLGFQGTVSVWRDATDLTRFAYRHPEHRAAIMRTPVQRWYAEEMFSRLEVRDVVGDRTVLGWIAHDGQRQ